MSVSSKAKLPALQDLAKLGSSELVSSLDLLFEPSPAIHETLLPILGRVPPYPNYDALIDACHGRLKILASTVPNPQLLSVLGSHPRLGARRVESAQSAAEQANLQGEGEELARLNAEYEAKFPGLRYVVFVNGRGRPEIMENIRKRIDRADYREEVDEALQAMCDIAKDRASKLPIAASDDQTV